MSQASETGSNLDPASLEEQAEFDSDFTLEQMLQGVDLERLCQLL
ncbi:hypothetical protein MNBD_GAMMA26-2126 [hydrothermal vent metagenome]|uniref:Uncharacterized protein n=1 Tax=hydrothermal vent metagenome TaxID=652676 RepID=A0A3B1BAK3_9ZZZZ